MKKVLSVFALFSACFGTAWAVCPGAAGGNCAAAARYDVNVQEVALCQDAACTSSYVVGSGAKTFDIASAAVGTAIGSYAKVDAIPVGVYTYVQVVINRIFKISTTTLLGGGGTCGTIQNNPTDLGIPQAGFDITTIQGLSWNDPATKTQIKMIQALPSPIAISKGGSRPSVTVKFNTQIGAMCIAGTPYPAPPEVALSIN